jgi:exodeoxyribonuclease VII large subunit
MTAPGDGPGGSPMEPTLSSAATDGRDKRPLSVGELSRRIVRLLEGEIGEVGVVGEVSGVRIPRSGHCYFMLKDAEAAIHAVCFRATLARCRFVPVDGMRVEAWGRVTAYPPRSEYQVVVSSMREAGLGELMRRFLELKEKLRREGLFDAARKRPIPRVPRTVGIVTSPTGAALRDILNVLGRRARGLKIVLSPAAVQGEAAPPEIVRAIERLRRHGKAEVIIVGRGGGSIEDLWAFNDERVARAIAASPIPIVSAVGHETDTTLADYAADLRAPTPSAAAELVSAHYDELDERLRLLRERLARTAAQRLRTARARLDRCHASWGMRHPVERLGLAMQRADELRERLERAVGRAGQRRRRLLEELGARLRPAAPLRRLRLMRDRLARDRSLLAAAGPARWRPRLRHGRALLDQWRQRLRTVVAGRQRERFGGLRGLSERLTAVSPAAILRRGYSIVTHGARDRVVTDPRVLMTGEVVRVRSASGRWKAGVLPPGDDLFDGLE